MTDKGYTTEAKINLYLGITITSGDADNYILAAQQYIDNLTGRNFKATDAEERLFDGCNSRELTIDDCIEVTKVEVGNDFWGDNFTTLVNTGAAPQYYLSPVNYSEKEEPIMSIIVRDRTLINGRANHKITAKWGYSETPPEDLAFAATVLASGMYYENKGAKAGKINKQHIGRYDVAFADDKKMNDFDKAVNVILPAYIKHFL